MQWIDSVPQVEEGQQAANGGGSGGDGGERERGISLPSVAAAVGGARAVEVGPRLTSSLPAHHHAGIPPRTHRRLLDMTADDDVVMPSSGSSGGGGGGGGSTGGGASAAAAAAAAGGGDASGTSEQLGARRMFVQLLFDASASSDACWHLEIRWNMCRGDKVEELIKYCARRAKQHGMLLLQVPTGRRPRPFSPPVLVPVPPKLQPRALLALSTRLSFVRESSHAAGDLHAGRSSAAPGERWMHELGVAFVQRDKHDRGFLWSVNRLLPSAAGRAHSESLLGRFREICERLVREECEAETWDAWTWS